MSPSPRTPSDLLTRVSYSSPPSIRLQHHQLLRSPLDNDHFPDAKDETKTNYLRTDDSDCDDNDGFGNRDYDKSSLELSINQLLIVLDSPNLKPEELDLLQIKTVLRKCLMSINHYKLQNDILKFENNESGKRNEIENDLIKKQVDFLLKSPLKPITKINNQSTHDNINEPASHPPTFKFKHHTGRITKLSKPKLKLVEKSKNQSPNLHDYNSCIKVFHLEKKT